MFERLFRRGPSEFNLQINSPDLQVRAQAKESLLLAAINQGVPFPYNCRVGGCGECKCRLVSGKVKELTDKSYLLSADELKQNFILACQSLPRSDLVIEVSLNKGRPVHPVVQTEGTITDIKPLTHDIVQVTVMPEHGMQFSAGQYAEIRIPDEAGQGAGQGRSYSFASANVAVDQASQQPAPLDFFIRKVPGGLFTTWLFEQARVGSKLSLQGPYGDFGLRPGSDPIVCIAGGSGLAPIKAVLEQAITDRQAMRPVVVLFGARTQKDLYGLDAIDQIRRNWTGRFEFVPILSAEPEGSDWAGRRGLITDHLKAVCGERLSQSQAYLCGPPPMIDACVDVFTQAGLDRSRIFFDKFLDSGHLAHASNGS